MVEDQRADAGLGVHHHAVGELDADLLRLEQAPQDGLVVEVGAGRVAEAVALAAVAGREAVLHRQLRRVRKAPLGAQPRVQPLRRRLGGLDGEGLDSVAGEELARLLGGQRTRAHPLARPDDEGRDRVADAAARRQHEVGEAQPPRPGLARELEDVRGLELSGLVQHQVLAVGLGLEEAPHRPHPHPRRGLVLQRGDQRLQLGGLGIALLEQAREAAAQSEVLAVEHLRVEVGPHLAQVLHRRPDDAVGTWRRHRLVIGAHLRPLDGPRLRLFLHGGGRPLRLRRRPEGLGRGPLPLQPQHDLEAGHGVGAVGHRAAVGGRDALLGEAPRQRGAAHQDRHPDARRRQVLGGDHHLVRRFDQQAREADGVRTVLAHRRHQGLRRDLDAEVDHLEAVVREDDLHQVLADVVDVALDGRQHHLAAGAGGLGIHELLEVGDRRLHGLGALQHLGDDELVVVEEPADLGHAGHQGAVDHVERRRALGQLAVEVLAQPAAAAVHNIAGQPLVQGLLGAHHRRPGGAAEVVRDPRHVKGVDRRPLAGFLAPPVRRGARQRRLALRRWGRVEEQRLDHLALGLRDRGVALQPFGVDNRQVETGLGGQVEEDRVDDLARPHRQPEGHVRDPEHGRAGRQGLLDQPQALDGLHRPADVRRIAARRREDQRVEDDVGLGHAVLRGQERVAAARDLELALAGEGLRLLRVLVDDAEDHRRAVAPEQRRHVGDPLLAVLEVDGVDDRLALAVGQRHLDRRRVGGVDHDRRLDRAAEPSVELADRGPLVALGGLQADVDDLRAALDLAARDLGRLVPVAGRHQVAELPRADDVGALAHQQRPVVGGGLDQLDAGERRAPRAAAAVAAGAAARDHPRDRRDVVGGGAAAAADDVDPAGVDEAFEGGGQARRGLRVAAVLVRQPGVGEARHRAAGALVHRAQVIGHEGGAGGAVEPYRQRPGVLDGGEEGVRRLPPQHGARGLDGPRHHQRPPGAGLFEHPLRRDQGGLGVAGVLAGLDEQQVHAALEQAAHLLGEGGDELGEGDAAGDRDRARGGADGAGDEAGPIGRGELPRRFDGELGGAPVERPRLGLEAVLGEHQRRAAEGVGLDDVGAGLEVGAVHVEDHVRPGADQVFVAALELGAAEVVRTELLGLQHGPGRAVEHQDPLGHECAQLLRPVGTGSDHAAFGRLISHLEHLRTRRLQDVDDEMPPSNATLGDTFTSATDSGPQRSGCTRSSSHSCISLIRFESV